MDLYDLLSTNEDDILDDQEPNEDHYKPNCEIYEKVYTIKNAELLLSNWLRISSQEGINDIELTLYGAFCP